MTIKPRQTENPTFQPSPSMSARTSWIGSGPRPGNLGALVALFALMALGSWGFAQPAAQPSEEWDAVEAGFVDLVARGNPALRQAPEIQIVSPPIEIDFRDPETVHRVLVETADTIPQWGAYFRPSGRTLRQEFQSFSSALETPVPTSDSTRPGAADAVAFRFSPDFAELASKGSAFLQPENIRWEVTAKSNSGKGRSSSLKLRIGIGPVHAGGAGASQRMAVDNQLAEGVFSATGMAVVNIIPGGWFSSSSIDRFAKEPFKPGREGKRWWGRSGRLGLYPRSLVVVSNPSFSLRMDARTYHEVRTAFASGAAIGVGPFQIKSMEDKTEVSFDEKLLTITVRKKSRGMIVAIINQVNGPS
jgi:hypothetical protein